MSTLAWSNNLQGVVRSIKKSADHQNLRMLNRVALDLGTEESKMVREAFSKKSSKDITYGWG